MMKRLFGACIAVLLMAGCGSGGDRGSQAASAPADFPPVEVSAPGESTPVEMSAPLPASKEEPAGQEEQDLVGQGAPEQPVTLSITVPEGFTLPRIGMLLEEKGICTPEEFIQAAQEGDFSEFPLAAAQEPDPNRCFALEGYLFPDTYEIYFTATPDEIIRRMLSHTEAKITPDLRAKVEQSGYTMDQILALASIIEKEAFGHEQMPYISSVLHNRLNNGIRLQCDVTIVYVEGAIKPFIIGDKNRYNSFYNTYKRDGVPPGAICNPGLDAIRAALNPADTDYFYFVTDAQKKYYYAATYEEHLANIEIAEAVE